MTRRAAPTADPTIRIAEGLTLPLEIITRRLGVLGGSGMGKTSTAVMIAEQVRKLGIQVVIIDPTGAWWGIAHNAAGDGPGADIAVLGGEHGIAPLSRDAGGACARLVAQQGLSAVLDIDRPYFTSWSARQHFVADFLSDLYELCRSRILVIVDEAHRFAPQNIRDEGSESARCLGAVSDVVALGRRRGLDVILVTQRMAKLHKDEMELCQVIIAHQLRGNNDRKALQGWLDNAGGDIRTIMAGIGKLQRGEAFVSAPAYDVDASYQILPKRTFDSSADASAGATVEGGLTSSADAEAIARLLASTIEEVKAEDPRALRKRIAELERTLADRKDQGEGAGTVELAHENEGLHARIAELEARPPVEVEVIPQKIKTAIASLRDSMHRTAQQADQASLAAGDTLGAADQLHEDLKGYDAGHQARIPTDPPKAAQKAPEEGPDAAPAPTPASASKEPSRPSQELAGVRLQILRTIIAAYPSPLTAGQVALTIGKQAKGGYFQRMLGELRTLGYLDGMLITPAGLEAIPETVPRPPRRVHLVDRWADMLDGLQHEMFVTIAGDEGIGTDDLAERVGKSAAGGYFHRQLGNLRTRNLIVTANRQHRLHPDFAELDRIAKGA